MPLLTFPMTRQATPASCGASAVQGLLYYYGIEKREDDLIDALGVTKEKGVGVTPILQYLNAQGLETTAGTMTLKQVKGWLDKRVPVLMILQAWSEKERTDYSTAWDDGHYVIAVGYDSQHLIIEDPSLLGNRGFIPFVELPSRWHDVDDDLGVLWNYGVAVWGREPVYNPRKMLHIATRRVASRWMATKA